MKCCLTREELLETLDKNSPIHKQIEYVLIHIYITLACLVNDIFNRGSAILGNVVAKEFVYTTETVSDIKKELQIDLFWIKSLEAENFSQVRIKKFSSKYRNLIRLIHSSEVYFLEQNEKNSVIYSEKDFEDVRFILEVIKEIIDFLNSI